MKNFRMGHHDYVSVPTLRESFGFRYDNHHLRPDLEHQRREEWCLTGIQDQIFFEKLRKENTKMGESIFTLYIICIISSCGQSTEDKLIPK